ncbi:hypothetical protein, partial [Pseudomonas syringae]|uniref:hypothetical protein n=1 Tax=Pseudomonas syringae TaxID=317 RepID=UPI001C37D0B4
IVSAASVMIVSPVLHARPGNGTLRKIESEATPRRPEICCKCEMNARCHCALHNRIVAKPKG